MTDSPKMDWDKVHKEDKERTQGVEWTGRRKTYRPWVTESSIEEEEEKADRELEIERASESPEMKAMREEATKKMLEDLEKAENSRPKWKSPLDDEDE